MSGRSRRRNRLVDSSSERTSSSESRSTSSKFSGRRTRKKGSSNSHNSSEGTVQDKKERLKKAERMKRAPLLDIDIAETVYSAMAGRSQRFASRHWLEQFAKYEEAKRPGVLKMDKFVRCLNKVGIQLNKREQYEVLAECFKVSGMERDDSFSNNYNESDKTTQFVDYIAFVDFACNVRDSEELSEIATLLRESISKYDGKRQSSTSYNMATDLEKLDRHKRGWITSTQFKRALQRKDQGPSIRLSNSQMTALVDRFEFEYEKQQLGIDYMQFAQWLQPLLHLELKKVHERVKLLIEYSQSKRGWRLDEVFQAMDDDKDGEIDAIELKEALLDMGLPLTDAQIRCLADEYDIDGDGKIQYHEFLSLFANFNKKSTYMKRKSSNGEEGNKMSSLKKRDEQKRSVRNSFSWGINKAFARKRSLRSDNRKSTAIKRLTKGEYSQSSKSSSSEEAIERKSVRQQKERNRSLDEESVAERSVKKEQRHRLQDSVFSDEGKKDSDSASDVQKKQKFTAKSKRTVRKNKAANLSATESEQDDLGHVQRLARESRIKPHDKKTAESAGSDDETKVQDDSSLDARKVVSRKKKCMKSTEKESKDTQKRNLSRRLTTGSQDRLRSHHKILHRQSPHRFRKTISPRRKNHVRRSRQVQMRQTNSTSSSNNDGSISDVSEDLSSGLDVAQLRRRQQKRGSHRIRRNNYDKHTHDDKDGVPSENTSGVDSDTTETDDRGQEWSPSDEEYHKHLKRSLLRAFDFFDLDQTSTIDKRELGHVLRALGHEFTSKELEVEMANADLDRNGQLDFHEFVTFVKSQLAQKKYLLSRQREMEIRRSFQLLDTDKNGSLNEQEFEYLIFKVLQVELSIEEHDALLDFIDKDADGVISEEEFIAFMKKLETLQGKYSCKGNWKKQNQFMESLDTNTQLAYSAMKKLVRGALMDIDQSLLMFFGIPSNFRPAISSAAVCRTLHDNTMEHVLSIPSPQTIETLALDTTPSEKKPWFTLNWLDTNSEECRILQMAESVEAQAIVSLKRAAGVPKPFDTREDDVVKRCVHVCLFQQQQEKANTRSYSRRRRKRKLKAHDQKLSGTGLVVGNVHEIPVYWHPGEEDVWEFSRKATKQDKYKFLVRTNAVNDRLYLLVEFIVHLKLNTEENQSINKRSKHRQAEKNHDESGDDVRVEEGTREMVCCWCKIPVRRLLAKRSDILRRKEKLWGGTANAPVDIEQDELLRRRTGWRALTTMFTKPSPPLMGIKSVPIDLFSDELQSFVRKMPPIVIAPFVALPILAEYMILVRKTIASFAGSSSGVTCEPALKLLPKIVDDHAALSIFRKAFDNEVAGIKLSEDRHLKFQQLVLRMWPSFVQWRERFPPTLLSSVVHQDPNSDDQISTPPSGISIGANAAVEEENLQVATQMRLNLLQTTADGKLRLQDVHVASTPFHVREVAFYHLL